MASSDFSLSKVQVALSPMERFNEFLQSRGMRRTPQRRIIVQEVFLRHEHFEAEDLIAHFQSASDNQKVSRPTVYRTLRELVEAGLLREVAFNDRRSVYEHDYGYPQHDHLHCSECHQLIEFSSDELVKIREAVAREHQFQVTSHRLIINGLCADCRKSKKRPSLPVDRV